MPSRIFIVDDDEMFAQMLKDYLEEQCDAAIVTFPTGEAALPHVEEDPDLVILDFYLNSREKEAANGLDILKEMRHRNKHLPVIMLSSQENYGTAAQTIAHGAIHYVVKGKNAFEEVAEVARANLHG